MSKESGPRRVLARAAQSPIDLVLERIPDARPCRKGWMARCPAHDDRRPSLSIGQGDDGRVLLRCHADCKVEAICSALGIAVTELFPSKASVNGRRQSTAPTSRIVAIYPYRDEGGALLFEAVRYDPKKFAQRRPDGKGGHIWNLNGVRRVLYRLPELRAADPTHWVFVTEGEKHADRLASHGLIATTNPAGAGKWQYVDDAPLHERRVVILADADEPGRQHAEDVAQRIYGKAAEVRVVHLPGLPLKGDVIDWLDAGHTIDELRQIMEATAPYKPSTQAPSRIRAVLLRASDVKPQRLKWFWTHRIPLRKTTSLSGPPDVGKSMVTIYLAARVSSGTPWPDLLEEPNPTGGVVIVSAEDDPEDTIVPRLIAAGADPGRVNILEATELTRDSGDRVQRAFSLDDLAALEDAIMRTPECRLVVVDPVSAFLGSADSHKNAEVRAVLAPLAKMAARHDVAVVLVNHLNKNGSGPAVNRTMGSLAFIAAPRAAWVCVHDKADPTRRLFLRQKLNIASQTTGLAYRIVPSAGDPEVPVVQWDAEPVTTTADEALADEIGAGRGAGRGARVSEAVAWLKDLLANGPLPQGTIEAAAKKGDLKWRTVQRAKSRLAVVSRKQESAWEWSLPEAIDEGGEAQV